MEGNSTNGKRELVRDMFDDIAPRYDLLNHVLSLGIDRRWRKKALAILGSGNTRSILDLAAGTGDMTIGILKKLPETEVTAADLSENMLAIARGKISKAGYGDRARFVTCEAERLPFGDETFDAATVAFGVRNFHNVELGLSEIRRVLKKEGRIVILEFSTPRNKIFGALYRFYFHRVLPTVGGWVSGNGRAYRYLPDSVDNFPQAPEFTGMMARAGFTRCQARSLTNGVAYIYTGIGI